MNTRSQAAHPPSQSALSTETFEELLEISHVSHENQDLHCCVSRLKTQLSQLLNDNLALQGQCDALTARVKFLEDSMENSAASSIPKMDSSSNKCKKRRRDAFSKAQSGLRTTTSSPQAARKKPAKSAAAHRQLSPDVNLTPLSTDNPIPISPSHSPNPSISVAQPDQPRTLGHPDHIASDGPWRDVQRKRRKRSSAEKSPSNSTQQNPRVPRNQCLIVHGLP